MRHLFVSQSLYKPKGSQEDISKVKDVTARLTDPAKFPRSHSQRVEETRSDRERKLGGRSYQSFGSINSIAQSNSNLSTVTVASIPGNTATTPAVFRRLSKIDTK